MKKYILPFLLLFMFIPIFVNAETCDTDKITISSITIESKSDSVEELDEATASGKIINLNLSMSEVGDNITYKIIVKNDSNEDYELDKNSLNLNSDYVDYTFKSEDDSNVVKANSSKIVYLKVNYANEVPDDAFESGTYNDNQSMTINLSTGNSINVPDALKNPNTGVQSYIVIIFIILLISITAYVLLKKKKYTKFMVLIIGVAIIIPISVFALCKCDIKIESKVEIRSSSSIAKVYISRCFSNSIETLYIPYEEGMTGSSFINSDFTDIIPSDIVSSLYNGAAQIYEFDIETRIEECLNESKQTHDISCIHNFGKEVTNISDLIYSYREKEYLVLQINCTH